MPSERDAKNAARFRFCARDVIYASCGFGLPGYAVVRIRDGRLFRANTLAQAVDKAMRAGKGADAK